MIAPNASELTLKLWVKAIRTESRQDTTKREGWAS